MEPLELHLDLDTRARLPADLLVTIARQLRYRALITGYSGMSFRYEGSRYVCVLAFHRPQSLLHLYVATDNRGWLDAVRQWFKQPVW